MSAISKFRTIKVPLYPRIINYGVGAFENTAAQIDALSPKFLEWDKVNIFSSDLYYLQFISNLCSVSIDVVVGVLNDFLVDMEFKEIFSARLHELSEMKNADDLRFNSLSVYCIVRLLKPDWMIETGVAQGKSSSMVLLAMHHNKKGCLISIDLPNPEGHQLADGAYTSTGEKDVGWLVPNYLRERWNLKLGDAKDFLPDVLSGMKQAPDIFFHDSLHTYDHTKFEFETVLKHMSSGAILCDNIDMGSGQAFHDILDNKNKAAHAYRDFAGVLF